MSWQIDLAIYNYIQHTEALYGEMKIKITYKTIYNSLVEGGFFFVQTISYVLNFFKYV